MSRYRPKDTIFKTLGSYAKNFVHEVKNSIKSSKMVKNGPSNRKTVSSSALRSGGSMVQCCSDR